MAICDIELTPDKIDKLASVAVKRIKEAVANDSDFDIEKTLRDFYIRGIENNQSAELMAAYVQQFPRIYVQVIGHIDNFTDYLVDKDFDFNRLNKLRKSFSDFNNVIEFLKEDEGLSKKRIKELNALYKKESTSSSVNTSKPKTSIIKKGKKTGEVLYDASPSTFFATLTRPHKFAAVKENERIEDENESFYLNFKKELSRLLRKNKNLGLSELTYGGHTGFKMTIMSSTKLRDKDLRESHRKRKNDKVYTDYRYDEDLGKDVEEDISLKGRKKSFQDGVSAVITDVDGNILYFKENKDGTYSVVDKKEGVAIYDNIRKNSKINEYGTRYTTLQSFSEISDQTGLSIKKVKEFLKEEFDALWNMIDYIHADKKNNIVINDITAINPGYLLRMHSEDITEFTKLSDVKWEETPFGFDIDFEGSFAFINLNDDVYQPIRVWSPLIENTRYQDLIIELATNDNLKIRTRTGRTRKMTAKERVDYINSYFYAKRYIEFLTTNKNDFVVKIEGEIVEDKDEIENTLNKIFKKYTLNINKTLLRNNKINDITDIENNIVDTTEMSYKDWIKENNYTQLIPNDEGLLPILGGYYIFQSDNEYLLNSKNQKSVKRITDIQNKVTNKSYLTSKEIINQILNISKSIKLNNETNKYERYVDGRKIEYNRVTDVISPKNQELELFSLMDERDENDIPLYFNSDNGLISVADYHSLPSNIRDLYDNISEGNIDTINDTLINLKTSTEIGNNLDELVRDYFSEEGVNDYEDYVSKIDNTSYFVSEDVYEEFLNELDILDTYFEKNNEEVISKGIVLHNDELGVAGTPDLLTVNTETGAIKIYDIKSKKQGTKYYDSTVFGMSDKEKFTLQLSAYNILLNNTYKLKSEENVIITFKPKYGDAIIDGNTAKGLTTVLTGVTREKNTKLDIKDQVDIFGITESESEFETVVKKVIRISDPVKTILLPVKKDEISDNIQNYIDDNDFDIKDEEHITVIGFGLKRIIEENLSDKSDNVRKELNRLIKKVTEKEGHIAYTRLPEYYMISKTYPAAEWTDKEGKKQSKPSETRQSIIQKVNSPDILSIIETINKELDIKLDIPFPHISIATKGNSMGIGINSEKEFDKLKPQLIKTDPISKPTGSIEILWGGKNRNKSSESDVRILSNLAPRKFTYEEKEYGSVEHAYQSLKSGEFDQATYDKYNNLKNTPGFGKKIRGKNADYSINLELMKDLVIESFVQNSDSKAAKGLLKYAEFTHPSNTEIDEAFIDGLYAAQNILLKGNVLKTDNTKPVIKNTTYNSNISDNNLDDITDELRQSILKDKEGKPIERKITKEELAHINKAEKWYNDTMPRNKKGELLLKFTPAFNAVNSDAYAQFMVNGITLYKGSNYTDLYHEAWHGFTQLFLPSSERQELYDSVKKDSGKFKTYKGETKKFSEATDKEIEEYLAEDFKKYMLSDGKLKVSNVKKSIFQKILDFLKYLFYGTSYETAITRPESIAKVRELQQKLSTGEVFNKYKYNINNPRWGQLNYGIEPVNDEFENLDIQKSRVILKSIDSLFSEFINLQNAKYPDHKKWTSVLFTQPEIMYVHGYNYALRRLSEQRDILTDQSKIDLIDYAIANWGDIENLTTNEGVVAYHRNNSKYLSDRKLTLDTETIQELTNEINENITWQQTVEGSSNKLTSKETASNEILFLIKSLHKYDNKGNSILDPLGFHANGDFNETWSRLQKILQSLSSPQKMYAVIENEIETDPKFTGVLTELKNKLGNPHKHNYESEAHLWTKFWQTFNKSVVPLEALTYERVTKVEDSEGNIEELDVPEETVTVGRTSATLLKIKRDINSKFKSLDDSNGFIEKNKYNQNYLNAKKGSKFIEKYPTEYDATDNVYQFLYDAGIRLDDNKMIINELNRKKQYKTAVKWIYKTIRTKGFITDISKDLKTESGRLDQILELQARYSDKYSNFSASNVNNDIVNEFTFNGSINRITNAINESKSLSDLVKNYPYMSYLDPEFNPQVSSNRILQSIYDFNKPEYPKVIDTLTKKEVKLLLINLSGVARVTDGILEDSDITLSLSEYDKLIQDIHTTLLRGTPELPRHGSKSQSLSLTASRINAYATYNTKLYVDSSDFYVNNKIEISDDIVINKGFYSTIDLLIENLKSEIDRINIIKKGNQPEVLGYTAGDNAVGKELSLFKGMLSTDLYNAITELNDKNFNNELFEVDFDTILDSQFNKNFTIEEKLIIDLNTYLENVYQGTRLIFNELPFISNELLDEVTNNILKKSTETEINNNDVVEAIIKSYVSNQMLNKFDMMGILYGDPLQYNMAKEDFHKRNSSLVSAGQIFRNDPAIYNYINNVMNVSDDPNKFATYAASIGHDIEDFNGIIDTVILQENLVTSGYINDYENAFIEYFTERYKDLPKNIRQQTINNAVENAISPYREMEEGDAQGYLTFDMYRMLGRLQGKWSNEQEDLYNKIINGEDVSNYDLTEYFPVRKYQYSGPLATTGTLPLIALHKYSLLPLIPNLIEGTNLQLLHDKLVKENKGYATYQSSSKISTITEDGKANPFYQEQIKATESRVFDDSITYLSNPIYIEFLKDQIDINESYKRKATFATQFRKLVELNLFNKGRAISSKMKNFVNIYEGLIEQRIERSKEEILKESGYTLGSKDVSGLIEMVVKHLKARDLSMHELDFINADPITGEIVTDLSLSLNAPQIEKLLMALVNNRLIREKLNGEMLIQVSNSGFESSQFTNPSELDLATYGTNGLTSYIKDPNTGLTVGMGVKIALQGDFKKLLNAEHIDGQAIKTLDRLNAMITDEKWLSIGKNRDMITMVGVRIPVQGLNSMEFMQVQEFLPESAGNIIIPPSEIVAKSGSDFDVDKLSIYMPNISLISNKPELVENMEVSETEEELLDRKDYLYDTIQEKRDAFLQKSYKDKFNNLDENLKKEFLEQKNKFKKESKEDRKKIITLKKEWDNLFLQSRKVKGSYVLNKLNEVRIKLDEAQERVEELSSFYDMKKYQIFTKEQQAKLEPLYQEMAQVKRKLNSKTSKGIDNDMIMVIKNILEQPENFVDLILPIGNVELEDIADKLASSKVGKEKYSQFTKLNGEGTSDILEVARIFEPMYNLYKHASNSIGKDVLGLYAVNNTFNSQFNRIGMYIDDFEFKTKGGFENRGKGTPQGDGKDKAMRKAADAGFIGEIDWTAGKESSTLTSFNLASPGATKTMTDIGQDAKSKHAYVIALKPTGKTIMLARNGKFNGIDLLDKTKNNIADLSAAGYNFVVGDMPGVDSYFIDYLKSIDADYTVYHTGNNPRINLKVKLKLPHNKRKINKKEYISLSNIYDVTGNKISDTNSQLINGAVDVEKKAWLFDINAGLENAPILTTLFESGVSRDLAVYFISNPYVSEYVKQMQIRKSIFSTVLNVKTGVKETARRNVFNNKLNKFPWNMYKLGPDFLNSQVNKYENEFTLENLKSIAEDGINDNNRELAQALFYHYLQLEDPASNITTMKTNLNYDTKKSTSLYQAFSREQSKILLKNLKYVNPNMIDKLLNESIIGKFDISNFSIRFLTNLFELRNHENINSFLLNKINEPGINKIMNRMRLGSGPEAQEKYIDLFKNEYVSSLFQNKIKDESKLILESDGNKYYNGLRFEDIKSVKFENFEDAVVIKDGIIYMDPKTLKEKFKNRRYENLSFIKSEEEYMDYLLEKEYLRYILKPEKIVDDPGFIRFINEAEEIIERKVKFIGGKVKPVESEEDFRKRKITDAYNAFLKNKALDNIYNRYKIFRSSKRSYAIELIEIINKNENLLDQYEILNNIQIDEGYGIFNLKFSEKIKESEILENYYMNLIELMDPSIIKNENQFENKRISEFFQRFPFYAFLQSGQDIKTPLSMVRAVPNENIINILKAASTSALNILNSKDDLIIYEKLEDFAQKFEAKYAGSNSKSNYRFRDWTVDTQIMEDLIETSNIIGDNIYSFSFKDIKDSIKVIDNTIKEINGKENVVLVAPSIKDKDVMIIGKDKANYSKINKSNTVLPITVTDMIDENFDENVELLNEQIKMISDQLNLNGNNIIFIDSGYGTEFQEKAPRTYSYLTTLLYEEFGFINPGVMKSSELTKMVQKTQEIDNKYLRESINSDIDKILSILDQECN